MSKFIDSVVAKAIAKNKKIVLPEGNEPRTIRAARIITDRKIARITLIGNREEIASVCPDVDVSDIEIVDPVSSPKLQEYTDLIFELRKAKGMTYEEAQKKTLDPMYFGMLMLKAGDADGFVSGAIHSTGDMLRPALQIIKTKPGIASASSCFVIVLDENSPASKLYGENGVLLFADCGVIPNPTAEQLADIAYATNETAKNLVGMQEPTVAMLSYSTNGSAKGELVDKVTQGLAIAREKYPDLVIDGEMQADAALVKEIGELKFPGSKVAGKANVLIFPDIQAANISYKLVQRLANAEAYGPLVQGVAKSVNDLSRGCSVEDIVSIVAITAVNA